MTPTLYGQMQSERHAQENLVCREVVREINNVGVTQRQLLMIVYLLASELEDIEQMRSITGLVRQLGGQDLLLIGHVADDEGGPDGTTDA